MFRESVTFDDGGFRKIDVDSHATIDNKFRLTDSVSYTHLTLPTNREV